MQLHIARSVRWAFYLFRANQLSHYRKIDTQIWNDKKVIELSNDAKLAFVFTLTHPNMTSLGAMRATIEGIASEINVSVEALMEVLNKDMLKADQTAKLIYAPNFIKYNKPESPNVVRAWGKAYDMLPECQYKIEIYRTIKCVINQYGKGYMKAFMEVFPKDIPKGMRKDIRKDVPETVSSEQ